MNPLETTSRAQFFAHNNQQTPLEGAEEAVQLLHSLLAESLEYDQPRAVKHTRIDDEYEFIAQTPQLFRLVSSTRPPVLLSLDPPPPPSITREPASEDSAEDALLREERARQCAVDADWVLRESLDRHAQQKTASNYIVQGIASPPPPLLIVSSLQPPRRTRPPTTQKLGYPYQEKGPLPAQPTLSKGCLVVDEASPPSQPVRAGRRRKLVRPPPAFWRPSPALKGKCRGYGYGYTSGFAL